MAVSNINGGQNGGGIYYTSDSGKTWTATTAPANTEDVQSVAFSSSTNGVAVLVGNTSLYSTTDGGITWTENKAANNNSFLSIAFAPSSINGAAVGANNGGIYSTNNGGENWKQTATTGSFADVAFSSATNGFAVQGNNSNNGIYSTTDGGQTWKIVFTNSGSAIFNAIALAPSN